MPRWSPDGQALAFLSTRDGQKPHLFLLEFHGGEARQITRPATLSEGVKAYDWHPGGVAFCFTSTGHMTDAERQAAEERDERVYDGRLPIKADGIGLLDPRRAQLWRIQRDGSDLRQLTARNGDVQSPRWSPQGGEIAFVTTAKPEHERQYTSDLFVIDVDGTSLRQLTGSAGPVSTPVWYPDGSALLYQGHIKSHGNASNVGVWSISGAGGPARCL